MKEKKSNPMFEDANERISVEPLDHDEKAKTKRPKLVRWLLNIFEFIFDLFT
jgi:hypothetical protein